MTDRDLEPIPEWVPTGLSEFPTEQAEDIIQRLVPEWAQGFLLKNLKYKMVDNHLGPAGVFPDINRKVRVLELVLWEKKKLPPGEPLREIIMDLIGHLFLALHMSDVREWPVLGTRGAEPTDTDAVRPDADGGWSNLPDEVRKAIILAANGFEVVPTPRLRSEASEYLETFTGS